jgi:hypothetical protein
VGTAEDVSDAFDICAEDAKNYKRKKKTYGHLFWNNKKRKKNESEE